MEKAMASHSSTLAWKIPWVEELGRLQSMGLLRVVHYWMTSFSLFTSIHWRRKWQPTPVFWLIEFQTCPFRSIVVHWFLKCLCSFLPSPVWPFPICLDSWTLHSRFLRNSILYTIRHYFHHQSHPQLGIVFALAPSLHSFWSYFSTLLQ